MALPKLNNAPKYEMVIPSTGKSVRYRPFLVKEEKNLMIAAESGDNKNVFRALVDTIAACIDGEINTSNLTTFDVEYMFLQLRSKSVGESSKLSLQCSVCEQRSDVFVNLDEIQIEMPEVNKVIQLTNDISVNVDYPTFNDILDHDITEGTADAAFGLIRSCIKSINTDEERIDVKDTPTEELQDFLESMSSEQFEHIKNFVESIPKLEHDIEFSCESCKHHNTIHVEGVANFLS
jgi:hypothetical protein